MQIFNAKVDKNKTQNDKVSDEISQKTTIAILQWLSYNVHGMLVSARKTEEYITHPKGYKKSGQIEKRKEMLLL